MPKVRGIRPRTLSLVFGVYFLLVIVVAFVLSPSVAVYVMPSATFWISTAYVLLGAVFLLGLSLAVVRVRMRIEARITELEAASRRLARGDEIERLEKLRAVVPAHVAGPIIASIGLVGGFAPLLPAADGWLLTSLPMNAFVGVAGVGVLLGLAVYSAMAFLGLRHQVAP